MFWGTTRSNVGGAQRYATVFYVRVSVCVLRLPFEIVSPNEFKCADGSGGQL